MNLADKKRLEVARATISEVAAILEEIRDVEQEKFDEKSDKWKESPAGETEETRIASLSDAIDQLENIDSNLETAITPET
jgi:Tfp pilus assembly protein PilE